MRNSVAENRVVHYRAKEDATLLGCLTGDLGLSLAEAEWLLAIGAVYADYKRTNSDRALKADEYVRVHLHPKRYPAADVDWKAAILFDGPDFIVVNKPAGIPVHPTLDNQIENVASQVRRAIGEPVYVTQRLDNDVSGVLVLARTKKFQTRFNKLLAGRRVQKRYRAIVTVPPPIGRHVHYMEPTNKSPKNVTTDPQQGWLECALRVADVTPLAEAWEVAIDLETGRTHQIRVQLAALGSPIVGDTLYGSESPHEVNGERLPGIGLRSISVCWTDHDGTVRTFEPRRPL